MLKSALLELIANGESSSVEFKRDDIRPEQLAREVVALVNHQGGNVLLGVEDDGSIVGIQREDLEQWVMDTVFARYVHPWILPSYQEVDLGEGKRVAVVTVTQGTAKPYMVRHQDREEMYIRMGSTSRRATREQQARLLFASGGLLHTETLPVSGSGFKDLSRPRLENYLRDLLQDREVPASEQAWLERLSGLGFMTEAEGSAPVCSIAGLVLFGMRPRRLLRQAGIRWMAFAGTDKSYRALDDAVLDAPLVGLWSGVPGSSDVLDGGLFDVFIERVRPFVSEEPDTANEGLRRDRIWHYPVEALREAVVNAVAHRDWTRVGEVEVVRYADRLEVTSPGALQNTMTVEKMLAGQRSPRNPIIVDVLRDYGYVDARGMGVRRKILPLVREASGADPGFEATEDHLAVVLPKGQALRGEGTSGVSLATAAPRDRGARVSIPDEFLMEFRIADTFTDSLARLTGEEQKAVKTTAFDLQLNPTSPGMQLHKLDRARDKNFWSVRVSRDIRLIVHKTRTSLLLCYVDHHDNAYEWAERRKLETHPTTGAAQLVEVREMVREITIPRYVEAAQPAPPKPPIFARVPEADLLRYGVPPEWLDEVRRATEDTVLELADHLPREAAEALLDLATGVTPQVAQPVAAGTDPFEHPDAQRRFRTVTDIEELERALEYPWEKWTVFLHPAQRQSVERDYGGPARISGSAGTGKTIVALHRAVFLARTNPDARVLLTTFSDTLANALRTKLRRLISNEPRIGERLEVHAIVAVTRRLYELNLGRLEIASRAQIRELLKEAAGEVSGAKFSLHFLMTEWEDVLDAWQLDTWEAYRDVVRLGRKTRLPEKQREALWAIFERVRAGLKARELISESEMFSRLATHFANSKHPLFDFVVVDEAQDVSVAQLRFLAALGAGRPNGLFLAGDLGQRIFQQPFSWKALGVDIRGRSKTLRINYRTSHQIRAQADRLLAPEISDVDGNAEERRGAISVFNGPEPAIQVLDTPEAEIDTVSRWLQDRTAEGVTPHEFGVFVRSPAEIDRATAAVEEARLPFKVLDENVDTLSGHVSISTMHLAKGLEFRAVAVMACDDEVIPLQERIESVADDTDLEEVYNTERHLLYVACTRARDYLLVTSVAPASEFLDDLRM